MTNCQFNDTVLCADARKSSRDSSHSMNAKLSNVRQEPMHVAAARIVLGAIFASAALSYFWQQALGWPLLPMRITDRGMQFAEGIIRVGYLWPLMKAIN